MRYTFVYLTSHTRLDHYQKYGNLLGMHRILFNSWNRLCLIFLISLNLCCTYGDLDVTFYAQKLAQNGSLYLIVSLRPNCALLIHHVTLDLESRQTSKVLTKRTWRQSTDSNIVSKSSFETFFCGSNCLVACLEMKCIHNFLIHIAH